MALILGGGFYYWLIHTGRINSRAMTGGISITGVVSDNDGKPVLGATVKVAAKYALSGVDQKYTTGTDGRYSLYNLKQSFLIEASKDGTPFVTFYSDVPSSYWAYREISAITHAGITSGCGNFKYCPSDDIKRDQFAVFLSRAMKFPTLENPPTPSFSDVPINYPSYKEIETLKKAGIVQGCTATTFCPTKSLTRDQLAVFLTRALYRKPFDKQIPSFSDVSKTFWAYKEIEAIAWDGITAGCTDTTFCPGQTVKRDQMAVFLVRAFLDLPATTNGYNRLAKHFETRSPYLATSITQDFTLVLAGHAGKVFGQAINTSNQPMPGLMVALNQASEIYQTTTDSQGNYRMVNIPEGEAVIDIGAPPQEFENSMSSIYIKAGKELESSFFGLSQVADFDRFGGIYEK